MEALVSIIIPVYNCEKYISNCLDSIIGQTYNNLEIILVDDGSKDSSHLICKEYSKKDSRIVVLHKENGGPSSARNFGLRYATGDYIAFIDSDDIVNNEYIKKLYELLIYEEADISSCGYETILPNGNIVSYDSFAKEIFGPQLGDIERVHYPYTVWHLLFKRKLLENIKFDEEIFYLEDLKFVDEAFMKCRCMVGISESLYYRVAHEGSLTEKRYRPENFYKYFTLIKAFEDMCSISKKCEKLYKKRLLSLIKECSIMRIFMKNKQIRDEKREEYLIKIIKKYYRETRYFKYSVREKMILWICVYIPGLYCRLKKISFAEQNNPIT